MLTSDQYQKFITGVDAYNARDYFAAHDTWEHLWVALKTPRHEPNPPVCLFIQGLIQVSVGFYHVYTRESLGGAAVMLERATDKLAQYDTGTLDVNVETFLHELRACHAEIRVAQEKNRPAKSFPVDFPPRLILQR